MNNKDTNQPQWLDRQNGYWDLMLAEASGERMLGMVDTTLRQRARSFVRRADGTWKLADHLTLQEAKQEVESHAQV